MNVSAYRMSLDNFIVISVAANPEPQHAVRDINSQCPIMHTYTHGPELADFLKMKGWMRWVFF